ncbi:hypothetical protein Dsin_009366 [Dipteronia sinensis]|uniref:Cyclin-dependent kinase inhibitor n=1 Tax=Dipteronia sinensis TaxID=43782 RepID=A0AAE0AQF3_9ROSI|nr:hypothetical protein Dsin_009366 [Dipteronia sinensis]
MVRKYSRAGRLAEIAVMEVAEVVGVRTRARDGDDDGDDDDVVAPVAMAKRRKLDSDRRHVKLRNREITLENYGRLDHHDCASTSCCSGSSERIQFVDLEEDTSVEVETSTYYSCSSRERLIYLLRIRIFSLQREATSSSSEVGAESESEELDSTAKKSEANSLPRSTVEKMPTDVEIEQFFSKAENQLQKEFTEKYNFDTVKDEPMEGRYEWIRLKP